MHKLNGLRGQALWDAMKKEPAQWTRTTEGMYYEMLEAVPPAAMGRGAFLVGEPYTHNSRGEAVHACFANTYGDFFARYMTIREFRECGRHK